MEKLVSGKEIGPELRGQQRQISSWANQAMQPAGGSPGNSDRKHCEIGGRKEHTGFYYRLVHARVEPQEGGKEACTLVQASFVFDLFINVLLCIQTFEQTIELWLLRIGRRGHRNL